MIVHTFDVVEAGPGGLVGLLEPHDSERLLAVEAVQLDKEPDECQVEDCPTFRTYLVTLHRRHSRRPTEDLLLCVEHLERHRAGEPLRIVVESHR